MKSRWLGPAAALVLGFGVWQLAGGGYLFLKAQLAQVLLERSWRLERVGATDARPWPWADTRALMRLRVPRLGVEQIVLAGASNRTLAFGPGFLLASHPPGRPGVTAISGHRETHFSFLGQLRPGDLVELETPDGRRHGYRVEGNRVVDVRQSRLRLASDRDELVLITCYPLNALGPLGPQRYLVYAAAEETAARSAPGTLHPQRIHAATGGPIPEPKP